jgi:hypothetical protein
LSPLRLPVSPLRLVGFDYRFGGFKVKKIVFDNAEMRVLNGVLFFNRRGCSSVGRALEWHSRGQGFDPPQLHQKIQRAAFRTLPFFTPVAGSFRQK